MAEQRYEIFHDVLAEAILDWRRRYERERETEDIARRLEEDRRKQLEEQRARHRARVYRILRWGAVALGLLVIGLAVAVYFAVREGRIARSQGLASAAQAQLQTDPELSVLLASEAWEAEPTGEAEEAIRLALGASRVRQRMDIGEPPVLPSLWSANGEVLATVGQRTVQLWKASDGTPMGSGIKAGRILDAAVAGAETRRDSDDLVAVAGSRGVRALRPEAESRPISLTDTPASAVAASSDGRYVAAVVGAEVRRQTAVVWDATTGKSLASRRIYTYASFLDTYASFFDIAFDPSDSHSVAAAACGDPVNVVRLWDWRSDEARSLEPGLFKDNTVDPRNRNCLVAFSPDGQRIAAAARSSNARIWNVRSARYAGGFDTSAPESGFVNSGSGVEDIAWSPNGQRLAVAAGKEAAVLDVGGEALRSGVSSRMLAPPHNDWTLSIAYSPDGNEIATASNDGTARVWDVKSGTVSADLRGHSGGVLGAEFSPDGNRLLTASDDETALVWDVREGTKVAHHSDWVLEATYSDDASRIATVAADGSARLWTPGGRKRGEIDTRGLISAQAVDFDDEGRRVLVGGNGGANFYDGRVIIADARSGNRIRNGELKLDKSFWDASFSPDGDAIVVSHESGAPVLWTPEAETTRPLIYPEGTGFVFAPSAQFSPDGRFIATGGSDGIARIFNAKTREQIQSFTGHEGVVMGASFSGDSKRVVSYGLDRTARVWDRATGQEIAVLRGHTAWVSGADFSPDGGRVVTASADKTIRIWGAESGKLLAVEHPHADTINSVEFSPDGSKILSASDDNTAEVTACDTCRSVDDLLALVGNRTPHRALSEFERSEFLGED